MSSSLKPRQILLADDDQDDRDLFKEVLEELPLSTQLTIVNNGEVLIELLLDKKTQLPDILFLDLNLPRKNGIDCLRTIKGDEKLKGFPIIIFTTASDLSVVNLLHQNGAHYYIRKPNSYEQLKKVIHHVLILTEPATILPVSRDKFVLLPHLVAD